MSYERTPSTEEEARGAEAGKRAAYLCIPLCLLPLFAGLLGVPYPVSANDYGRTDDDWSARPRRPHAS